MLNHQLLAGLYLIEQRERLQSGSLGLLSGDPPGPLALPEDEVYIWSGLAQHRTLRELAVP